MLGDEANKAAASPPPTIEGLASMMNKVLACLDRLDVLDDLQVRMTAMECQQTSHHTMVCLPQPFIYGMSGYGLTSPSDSTTATVIMASASPTTSVTLPITSTQFPQSPSPIPTTFNAPYDGAKDPLN